MNWSRSLILAITCMTTSVLAIQFETGDGKLLKVLKKSSGFGSYESQRRYDQAYGPNYRNNQYYEPTQAPFFGLFATTPRPYVNGNNGLNFGQNNYQDPRYYDQFSPNQNNPYYNNFYNSAYQPTVGWPFNLFTRPMVYTTPAPFPFNLFQQTTTEAPLPFPLNLFVPTTPKPFPFNILG